MTDLSAEHTHVPFPQLRWNFLLKSFSLPIFLNQLWTNAGVPDFGCKMTTPMFSCGSLENTALVKDADMQNAANIGTVALQKIILNPKK
tara:strand:- start:306 stop:572 length:267 start_codon:yes stop_codon:yes gene_type:complete